MKILKEITRPNNFLTFFEHDGAIFLADLVTLGSLGFTECMIFRARKTNKTDIGYTIKSYHELYFAKDIPCTRDSLLACIKEFCRVTDEVSDGD